MKTLIIVANVEMMRAFQHTENPDSLHLGLPPAEIVLPTDAAAKRRWQGVDRRMEEISENVDWLVADEQADRWMLAAPLGVVASVVPWLNHETINRLGGTRIADLTALTPGEIGQVFEFQELRGTEDRQPGRHLVDLLVSHRFASILKAQEDLVPFLVHPNRELEIGAA